jgi:sec-independent protein translocase protein TatA
MIPNVGPMEIVVVLAIALIVFGPRRVPELGRSIGRGIRELRGSLAGDDEDEQAGDDAPGVLDRSRSGGSERAARGTRS